MSEEAIQLGTPHLERRWLPVPVFDWDGLVRDFGVEEDVLVWDFPEGTSVANGETVRFSFTIPG